MLSMKLLLKWKIWRIEKSIKTLVEGAGGISPMVWSFGAYYIDPKHLVFVIGVPSDEIRDKLKSNKELALSLINLLKKYKWPILARNEVVFDIESQETVDRDNNGNWWHHYK